MERYRRALLATAVLVGAALGNLLVVGTTSKAAMLIAGLQLVTALAVLELVAPRLRGSPTSLALLDGAVATGFAIALELADPALGPLLATYLAIIPLASALLFPWRPRTHLAAVAIYYATTVGFVTFGPISLDPGPRAAALVGCAVACALSIVGNLEATFRRHELARRVRQIRQQHARLKAIALERERDALTDPLTGLASRRALREDFQTLAARANGGEITSMAILDLDRFKGFNDRYGHAAGDDLLARIGALLRDGLRAGDVGYRYGGDEFLFIFPGTSAVEALGVIHRIAAELANESVIHLANQPWGRATFSAGVAEVTQAGTVVDTLTLADARLYRAKAFGGNRIVGSGNVGSSEGGEVPSEPSLPDGGARQGHERLWSVGSDTEHPCEEGA